MTPYSLTNYLKSSYPRYSLTQLLTLSALSIVLTACSKTPQYDYIEGETMGTSYHIRYQPTEGLDETALIQSINMRLDEINNSMSTYQDDSLISQFNRLPANQSLVIDNDFYNVMQDAKQVYEQSGGYFDPTVLPLISLWGFGKIQTVDRLQNPPTQTDIDQAKALIDFSSVNITLSMKLDDNKISKVKDGVQIDFSAIAKGYGVDVIAEVLRGDYHINNYMVEIGGEVATQGVNPTAKPWQIAIDAPVKDSSVSSRKPLTVIRQPASTMQLHLATSGNYRHSVVFDGKRYSHTIDPLSGQPVAGGAPSVTVAASSVSLADAWATALTAMPYEKALQMATDNDLAALFIIPKSGVLTDMMPATSVNATGLKMTGSNASDLSDNTSISGTNVETQWQVVETPQMQTLRKDRRTS